MPERWRKRLQHHFWRPPAFRELLDSFCAERSAARAPAFPPLVDRVADGDALAVVEAEIEARKLPFVGGRERLRDCGAPRQQGADRRETPLERAKAELLNAYLAIAGEASGIDAAVREDRRRHALCRQRATITQSACSRWRSWASTRAASISRQASGATLNTTPASPSRSRPTRRMAPSPSRAAGATTTCCSDMGSPVARSRRGLRHPHRPAEGGAGMSIITLAIPSKGRLMEATAELLAKAGFTHRAAGCRPWLSRRAEGHRRCRDRLPLGLRNRPEPARRQDRPGRHRRRTCCTRRFRPTIRP